jgi:hypothetical protein
LALRLVLSSPENCHVAGFGEGPGDQTRETSPGKELSLPLSQPKKTFKLEKPSSNNDAKSAMG